MTALEDAQARPAAAQRRTSPLRRALHLLSTVLIVSGVLLMADAGVTLLWQEPLSAIYNQIQQDKLAKKIPSVEGVLRTPSERRALAALPDPSARIAFAARAFNRKVQPGQAIGRIRIPRIGLSKVIVEGTEEGDLSKGPGHYPATPLPGAPGTIGIAGHRTTYGAPFRHVDSLRPGDRIVVQMPYATVTYRVQHLQIVLPTATWVVNRKPYSRLVLTACHPLYSAARRIVVFARQVAERPSPRLSS